jgi:hypothetical protein
MRNNNHLPLTTQICVLIVLILGLYKEVVQKSVNPKHSLVLMEMFRFKAAS